MQDYRSALIVGAGDGLSASLARLFAAEGLQGRAGRAQRGQAARAGGGDRCCDRRLRRRRAGPGRGAVRDDGQRRSAGRRTSSSTMPARAAAARWSSSTRRRWPTRCASPRSAASWSRSRPPGACCRGARARSCSPAPRPASRATSSPLRSRWASSPCAAWPRASPASWRRRASMSPTSSSTAPSAIPAGPRPRRRFDAGPRRDRAHLPPRPAAGAQRLDLGGRAAPLGRELLATAASRRATTAPAATANRTLGSGLAAISSADLLQGRQQPARARRAPPGRAAPRRRGPARARRRPPARPAGTGLARRSRRRPAATARPPGPCRRRPRRSPPRPAAARPVSAPAPSAAPGAGRGGAVACGASGSSLSSVGSSGSSSRSRFTVAGCRTAARPRRRCRPRPAAARGCGSRARRADPWRRLAASSVSDCASAVSRSTAAPCWRFAVATAVSPRPLIAWTTPASSPRSAARSALSASRSRPPRRREVAAPAGPCSPSGLSLDARAEPSPRPPSLCGSGRARTMVIGDAGRSAKKRPEGSPLPGISRPR